MDKQFGYRVLNLAGDVGEALLENGSEVYRVENSVCAVAEYFGFYLEGLFLKKKLIKFYQ